MNDMPQMNPAELAAQEALDRVFECISERKSFILEAGAGAGKTYTLIRALQHLIETKGRYLIRKNQKVACITYTNVAKDEIRSRTDDNPVILAETIHSFCWSLIKDFQPNLRTLIPSLSEKWNGRITDAGGALTRIVKYDLGYPKVEEHEILLHHDDVITLMVMLMEESKFRRIISSRYPIIFIDEYQDTDKKLVEALKCHFFDTGDGPLIGLFGDHWQKIYGNGCGEIRHDDLETIGKRANFRSDKRIIECLNRMRTDLPQEESDPNSEGSVIVYHTNEWVGTRRSDSHWKEDLPSDVAHKYLEDVLAGLTLNGWDISPENTKILMLTHNVLADEQGYRNIADVFSNTDSFIKKEDDYISFFLDTIEPVCIAYKDRHYGEMFTALRENALIRKHADKVKWAEDMDSLLTVRETGTIGEVIEHLKRTRRPRLPEKIERKEQRLATFLSNTELYEQNKTMVDRFQKLKTISYSEVIALARFIDEKTPFSTKHSVKGAEFENVLIVFGRGWNQYNFGQMLDWVNNGIPPGKQDTFERNRNLFYVACSRPKKRLALLFTQKLSPSAIETLSMWFGIESIYSLR
ncbi:MAG: UvrD-helicase domain-containing protein [Armatimonadota bacterium]